MMTIIIMAIYTKYISRSNKEKIFFLFKNFRKKKDSFRDHYHHHHDAQFLLAKKNDKETDK